MSELERPGTIARAAMAAVQDGRREVWLGLFAEATRVEDPVGHVPPIESRSELAGFWDSAIAPLASVAFEVTREWETSDEAMLLANVTIATATGAGVTYDGAFNYTLDDDGKIVLLRAFWDLPAVGAALAE